MTGWSHNECVRRDLEEKEKERKEEEEEETNEIRLPN